MPRKKRITKEKRSRGFTLIELLVVIAIIGLLASVILASLSSAREKARDAKRLSDMKQIQTALELYYSDHGEYPNSHGAAQPNGGWSNSGDASWDVLATKLKEYVSPLPVDPRNTPSSSGWANIRGVYNYGYVECGGDVYMFVFRMEDPPSEDTKEVAYCGGHHYEYGNAAVRTIGRP